MKNKKILQILLDLERLENIEFKKEKILSQIVMRFMRAIIASITCFFVSCYYFSFFIDNEISEPVTCLHLFLMGMYILGLFCPIVVALLISDKIEEQKEAMRNSEKFEPIRNFVLQRLSGIVSLTNESDILNYYLKLTSGEGGGRYEFNQLLKFLNIKIASSSEIFIIENERYVKTRYSLNDNEVFEMNKDTTDYSGHSIIVGV